jgi:YHS domain-containing protein
MEKLLQQAPEGTVTVNQADGSSVCIDPICGLEIKLIEEDTEHIELNGRMHWFCSLRCRWLFEAEPGRYAI